MPRPPAPGSQRGSPRPARASGWRASPVRLRIAPPAPCAWNCVTAAHRRSRSPPPLAAAPPRHRRPGLPPPLVAPARLIAYLLPSPPSPSEPCPLPLLPLRAALPPPSNLRLQALPLSSPHPLLPLPLLSLPSTQPGGAGGAHRGWVSGGRRGSRRCWRRTTPCPASPTSSACSSYTAAGATPALAQWCNPPPPPAPPPFLHRPHRYQRQPTPWPYRRQLMPPLP
jgi:hypothetical protein